MTNDQHAEAVERRALKRANKALKSGKLEKARSYVDAALVARQILEVSERWRTAGR